MSNAQPSLAGLSAVKLALLAKQARERSERVLRADPIAIVGMGCRVPGGGHTPQRFWELMSAGVDATRDIPPDRWDGDAWFDADVSATGKSITRRAGFLEKIDGFDAAYFGILPREAERMDPQQRLFLEVAIEAFDDAALTRERLRGSRTGVFIASYHNDYTQMQYADVDAIDARTLTGTLHSVLANRLSYFLDLHGPSLSIDTACSSSLVAIHLACQSLRYGESDIALAGGVSLIVGPELMVSMSKVGFMAADGRCKTFDAHADGFGRGEGCGLVVLKRLSDAIADGDRILAVVRGSAVNQDGHSTLLAAPHGPAQEALITEALANAQLAPGRIGLFEAHGTGTALGDPIEVEAIAATIGRVAGATTCLLGSVKANLGHLEAAAGVVGLIKTVLSLNHEAVPPQVHFQSLNPHISLAGTRLAVPTALTPWPKGTVPRCAGVSSFGVGGTNAHVIVEEAPEFPAPESSTASQLHVLPLSAQTPEALADVSRAWVEWLASSPDRPEDICFTAAQRRTHYSHRLAIVGRSKDELASRLQDFLSGASAPGLIAARRAIDAPRLAFVFSGQGPQWFAMGRELLADQPEFRDSIAECDRLLQPLSGWSLLEELAKSEETSRLSETEVAQPALFALQVALAALWKSRGVMPAAVVGHSVGEIAALHVAGILDLPTAIRVVWHRGRIMQQATAIGRMASVALTEAAAQDLLRPYGSRLSIAASNGPRSVVLSGDAAALEEALAELTRRGVSHRMLAVKYAFHSAQMEPCRALLAAELDGVRGSAASVPYYSTVTGERISEQAIDAAYFARNVREPVRFAKAINSLLSGGYSVFLELGPHPVLATSIAECAAETESPVAIVSSLRRGRPESETVLQGCAALHVAGVALDWTTIQEPASVVSLPAYPWQRQRYWLRKRLPVSSRVSSAANSPHPLLDAQLFAAGLESRIYQGHYEAGRLAWLEDHRIFDRVPMPAAAVLEMFAFAASRLLSTDAARIADFTMHAPLFLEQQDGAVVPQWQVSAGKQPDGRVDLRLFEQVAVNGETEPTWRLVASAAGAAAAATAPMSLPSAVPEPLSVEEFYSRFASLGVAFGSAFRTLVSLERSEGSAIAVIELPEPLRADSAGYAVHPVLIDAALQLCSVAAPRNAASEIPAGVFLPLGAEGIVIHRSGATRLVGRAIVEQGATGETLSANVVLETEAGERVLSLERVRFARATPDAFATPGRYDELEFETRWERRDAVHAAPAASLRGTWLVLADTTGVAAATVSRIHSAGGRCILAVAGERFERIAVSKWSLDPADSSHFTRLFAESEWATATDRRGILHCWALDTASFDSASPDDPTHDDLLTTGSTLHLVQAITRQSADVPVWVITKGVHVVTGTEPAGQMHPQAAGAWGVASVAAIEHAEFAIHTLDLDPSSAIDVELIAAELLGGKDRRVVLRAAQRFVPKLGRRRRAPPARATLRRVRISRPGTLDGVDVVTEQDTTRPARDEVKLRVLAAGLNFRDVLLALGLYEGERVPPLGAECAGEVVEVGEAVTRFKIGDRVFGYVPGSFDSEVAVPADFLAPLPAGSSIEEAAGLAVAYLTAFYGLHGLAGLQRGERVLIHAATGGVGLAAVRLAQRCGAEVFATAGSPEKREYLRALGVTHVGNSRTLDFVGQFLADTAGQGVHVVLNSLAGDFISASLKVLAQGGRFLELGKRGVWTPAAVAATRPDVRYRIYDLGSEAERDRTLLQPMFAQLEAALADGSLRPLPVKAFAMEDVREAMRYMAQARHIGKIVVRVGAESSAFSISPAASYLITGGLGALGLETARWLAASGARHLVLVGRRAPSAEAQVVVRDLEASGVCVRCVAADVGSRSELLTVLAKIRSEGPPLRGIVHAAGELRDGVLARQSWADARAVLHGKAHGAWNLHVLTREDRLDFFVLYSAAGAVLGAAGQGAYAAANAELDALAQARNRAGLPALSVAWGAWASAGMAARAAARGQDMWAARGVRKLETPTAFRALDRLLREGATNAAVIDIDWKRFLGQLPDGATRDFFADFAKATAATPLRATPRRQDFLEEMRALPSGQRREALMRRLAERVLQVLGLDPATPVDPRAALKDIGLDSLMAVELRNSLNHLAPKPLPVTLLFDYPTLDTLTSYLGKTWDLIVAAELPSAPATAAARGEDGVQKMTDAEAEAMLLAELNAMRTERAS